MRPIAYLEKMATRPSEAEDGASVSAPAVAFVVGTTPWRDSETVRRARSGAAIAVLLCAVAAFLLLCTAFRSAELDEGYSLALLSGHPRVEWPSGVFTKGDVAQWFERAPTSAIPGNLRNYDVHPPLWFYAEAAWRSVAGADLVAARLFPVLLTLLNFGLVAALARQCRAPVAVTCAVAFGSYAVLYTGSTVRMYPMALTFLLLGTWLLLDVVQRVRDAAHRRGPTGVDVFARMALAGTCFGLGTVTHLLILFPCIALCAVAAPSLLSRGRVASVALLAAAPLPFIAWASDYFLVQDKRDWQFPPFELLPAIGRIAQHYAGAVLGATPLLVEGRWQAVVGAALALVLGATILAAATGAKGMLGRTEGRVAVVGAVMMPVTLFLLGVAFDRQVSAPRYMVYSVPFLAIVVARGLRETALPRRLTVPLLAALLGLQFVSAATLPWARATQQAARPAIGDIAQLWDEGSILLLPEAADTTGMTLTFLMEAKPDWPMHYLRGSEPAQEIRDAVAGRIHLFLIALVDDAGRVAVENARAVLEADGWRSTRETQGAAHSRTLAWAEFRRGQFITSGRERPGPGAP